MAKTVIVKADDRMVMFALTADEQIAFNAGTRMELLQLAYADFKRLVGPKIVL